MCLLKRKKKSNPDFEITTSNQFQLWMVEQHVAIILTVGQINKVLMLGTKTDGSMHISEKQFDQCTSLSEITEDGTFWLSSLYQLWRFDVNYWDNELETLGKIFTPQMAYATGFLDIQDIIVDDYDTPIFVNNLFGCLATVSEKYSFKPIWKPPFLTKLVPEDRCHLTGLASKNGRPSYVTIASMSDKRKGWLKHRKKGGIVMDITKNEIVCDRLSMPNSPRWHNGKLYLFEAGTGYFGTVNFDDGKFEKILLCPGFLKGLDFVSNYAIISMSTYVNNYKLEGLMIEKNLGKENITPRCEVQIINLDTGLVEHWMRISGNVEELLDVKIIKQTTIASFASSDENENLISMEPNLDMIMKA